MSSNQKKGNFVTGFITSILAVASVVLIIMAGYHFLFGKGSASLSGLFTRKETPAATEAATEPTKPAPVLVTAADGRADSLKCKDSYTVPYGERASDTAATAGDAVLTNSQLQILYYLEISDYRSSGSSKQPDYSQPLDTQLCPLSKDEISWQHYFLEAALNRWQAVQAMLLQTAKPIIITEPDYKPDMQRHETYLSPELPLMNFLYADKPCFKPNSIHQAYLDSIPQLLEQLAQDGGAAGLQAMANTVFGDGAFADTLVQTVQELNLSYMYYTERTYDTEVTDEEVSAYASGHAIPGSDTATVDFRHVLLIPDKASVADDGTVTAPEEEWKKADRAAESLLNSWKGSFLFHRNAEAHFARVANENSADLGSKLNGGLYCGIQPGQLTAELDAWLFAPGRQVGDYGIVRTALGNHLVYVTAISSEKEAQAKKLLLESLEQEKWEKDLSECPLTVNYDAIGLWADCSGELLLPTDSFLYPDVSHERFPEVMVYLQQDYQYTPFGGVRVGTNGCGITTMAMLSTYMADKIYTPAMMASTYPMYCVNGSTDGNIFRYVPAELGFYYQQGAASYEEVLEHLRSGRIVIALENFGHFTSGGHYLLLEHATEDGDVVVRDSNIFNYKKLSGHMVDHFTKANILSGLSNFWVLQPKITKIPSCVRCGGGMEEDKPEALMSGDYLCERCTVALTRRDNFLSTLRSF